jgi:hypothetical protein
MDQQDRSAENLQRVDITKEGTSASLLWTEYGRGISNNTPTRKSFSQHELITTTQ